MRTSQPRKRRRQRLLVAHRRLRAGVVEQPGHAMRVFVGAQRSAEDERQRHETDGGDVGAMIESRRAGARRQRDAQVLPQTLAVVLQLLDRRSQHVLGNHQPRVRRDDQTLGRDQAMRDVAGILVQERNRRHQLTNQAQRRAQIEMEPPLGAPPAECRRAASPRRDPQRSRGRPGWRSTRRTRA